ncbi:MAG: transposase, partial [Planctomycetaceae bacterium]
MFRLRWKRQARVTRELTFSKYAQANDFAGILVTDCYAGYDAQPARAKQKCLAHLTRTTRDWQQVVPEKSLAWAYFVKGISRVTRASRFHRRRNTLDDLRIRAVTGWLR